MEFFKKLSEEKNVIAEFMFGTYYLTAKRKQKEGIHLLEKAAEQGNDFFHYNLAILVKQNLYVKPRENFLSILIKASEHYDKVKKLLADYYLMNRSGSKDSKKRWISINN